MHKFIDFSTSRRRQYAGMSLGNPLHDGKLPSRLADTAVVRVDGEPITFSDEQVPETLLRALYDMKRLQPQVSINCRRFAALMFRPEMVETMLPMHFMQPDYASPVATDDRAVTKPVVLGIIDEGSQYSKAGFYNRHMAAPAHTPEDVMYLHKLGFDGPICLSGLQTAMDMYACTHAYLPRGFATGELS